MSYHMSTIIGRRRVNVRPIKGMPPCTNCRSIPPHLSLQGCASHLSSPSLCPPRSSAAPRRPSRDSESYLLHSIVIPSSDVSTRATSFTGLVPIESDTCDGVVYWQQENVVKLCESSD